MFELYQVKSANDQIWVISRMYFCVLTSKIVSSLDSLQKPHFTQGPSYTFNFIFVLINNDFVIHKQGKKKLTFWCLHDAIVNLQILRVQFNKECKVNYRNTIARIESDCTIRISNHYSYLNNGVMKTPKCRLLSLVYCCSFVSFGGHFSILKY